MEYEVLGKFQRTFSSHIRGIRTSVGVVAAAVNPAEGCVGQSNNSELNRNDRNSMQTEISVSQPD